MEPAVRIAVTSSGLFFFTGLVTGVWKYREIMNSPDHRAPYYVDICHRTALMYSFACLVLAEFARQSAWSPRVDAWATAVPIVFFALAVAMYALHGWLRDTDNQLEPPHRLGKKDRARRPDSTVHDGARHRRNRRIPCPVRRLSRGPLTGFVWTATPV